MYLSRWRPGQWKAADLYRKPMTFAPAISCWLQLFIVQSEKSRRHQLVVSASTQLKQKVPSIHFFLRRVLDALASTTTSPSTAPTTINPSYPTTSRTPPKCALEESVATTLAPTASTKPLRRSCASSGVSSLLALLGSGCSLTNFPMLSSALASSVQMLPSAAWISRVLP